ncbi:hypothetical protein PLICRDRAFT_45568 [Plicaturopsis crispa FD-325 SS-3]|uniref:Protein CPL1-like domain-containing protein n=1 Tax=Plicaturopsis crispa FD-325 SS-3 TaxID=944288 RepID=A0A0C9T632_PLICR|nr:hypothetical protein PLICRDRAFT_45568 [Plicaturopsis crispa FD-325 SS-3]
MRGFTSFVLAALSVLSATGAYAQGHLGRRALLDVCANVDVDLNVLGIVFGKIDVCLCLSAIPTFLETNVVAIAAVDLLGIADVTAALTALINAAPDHKTCHYPDHALPQCIPGSPCGFSCSDGFVPSLPQDPTQCVCPAGKKVCNGVCTSAPCPSGLSSRKRDVQQMQYWAQCPRELRACGVYGGAARAWECVDTESDLESCGGCAIPLFDKAPSGVDCTALHGVSDVACMSGHCVVKRCMPGFEPSVDGSVCLSESSQGHGIAEAVEYAVEHLPFWKH